MSIKCKRRRIRFKVHGKMVLPLAFPCREHGSMVMCLGAEGQWGKKKKKKHQEARSSQDCTSVRYRIK